MGKIMEKILNIYDENFEFILCLFVITIITGIFILYFYTIQQIE